MRPRSIIWFERFFLASLLLSLLNTGLSFGTLMALLNADPIIGGTGYAEVAMIATAGIRFGIQLLLWFLIARKASNIAKWILVALTVLGIASLIPSIWMLMEYELTTLMEEGGAVTLTVTFLITVLQIAAIFYLFRPDAKAWLESSGKTAPDSDVFS